jgi:LmbE family N-acetylglucosaminyl deacetylase
MHYQKLVISPHIDDETLGCGGILDHNTFVLEIGVDNFHVVSREERIIELQEVKKILNFEFEILEGNIVNSYKIEQLIDPISHYINKIKPEEIYLPYPSYNQDHRVVYEAALIALRPHDINFFVNKVFIYEETQVYLWDYSHNINGSFKPNYFKNIDIERKMLAYQCLKSQVRSFRSPIMLKELAKIRGRQSNLDFAEAYQIIRYIN